MSWYRQYRPSTISGLHLKSVRDQLEKLRNAKTFPHALLLTGPRGAGKTSTARIIAAMLNDPANAKGAPYTDPNPKDELVNRIHEGQSLAVNEMDAASHRGIDDVRALKEQAYLPPQEGTTLVFILDEVHMLTTEAFNALLKLLEEPPEHVVFILATTEEHKVPATIVSRSTVIRFQKASHDELKSALEPIIKNEKLKIDADALDAIVQSADGSFRDAVKLLETVAAGVDNITLKDLQKHLRSTPDRLVFEMVDAVVAKDEKKVVAFFATLRDQNADQKQFVSTLLQLLHHDLITSVTNPKDAKYSKRVSQFLLTRFSLPEVTQTAPISFLGLELKSLELIFRSQTQDKKSGNEPTSTPPRPASAGAPMTAVKSDASTSTKAESLNASDAFTSFVTEPITETITETEVPVEFAPAPMTGNLDRIINANGTQTADSALSMMLIERWPEFIVTVEKSNLSLSALLRSAKASLGSNGLVTVEVYYQFHRDQLKQPKFQQMLENACAKLLGQATHFEFQLASSGKVAQSLSSVSVPTGESENLIQLAQEVFM